MADDDEPKPVVRKIPMGVSGLPPAGPTPERRIPKLDPDDKWYDRTGPGWGPKAPLRFGYLKGGIVGPQHFAKGGKVLNAKSWSK